MASIAVNEVPNYMQAFYENMGLEVQDYGEQQLEETKEEIIQRETDKKMAATSGTSTLTYILLGVGAVAVLTLAVLKKKGIL